VRHSHTTVQQSPHYSGMPKIHPENCPFPFDDHHLHLIHLSLDRPHSPSQTAPGSNQPFCHSTLSGQTDRPSDTQTHRWSRTNRMVSKVSAYARYIDREQRANKSSKKLEKSASLSHNHMQKKLQWDAHIHPQNCPFPIDDHHPDLIYPSVNRPHLPPQTASGYTQPFFHSSPTRQTDQQTYRQKV